MTEIIPDPETPETRAIGPDGRLLRGVFAGDLDADGNYIEGTWRHVGWAEPIQLGKGDLWDGIEGFDDGH